MSDAFVLHPEVATALARRQPVVALETTLVTHGLPWPEGLQAAAELEGVVRAAGAVPATIGVLEGRLRVGLAPEELQRLASGDADKLNLSNLAAQLADSGLGSTTVAASIFVASRAGIEVLATGGIGGVHRDVERTGDVSSDLTALARFPVAVVCAGARGAGPGTYRGGPGDAGGPRFRPGHRPLPRLLPPRQRSADRSALR